MTAKAQARGLDVAALREDFPVLAQEVHGKPLAYLDNAASSQSPRQVIDALVAYYEQDRSNVHRGVHALSQRATDKYEAARVTAQKFVNAASYQEIVWTRGMTESLNLVASAWGRANVRKDDEVLISGIEHHSNIVPWQMLCDEVGAKLRVIPLNDRGELIEEEFQKLLTERTKVLAVNHVSNALGTVNPIAEMIAAAHEVGAVAVIDGAQAVPHMAVDVCALDADFYAFSGHKIFGPNGIGVLYGKKELLEAMPPYQGGGDMIASVTFEKTVYNELPYKFEAGTPNIGDTIALGVALDYVQEIGLDAVAAYEAELVEAASEKLGALAGVRLIGTAAEKASVVGFVVEGVHPHDVGTILDREGVAIRAGHHCAQPVMDFFEVPATNRASFAFYNTHEEIDRLVEAVRKAQELFG